MVLLPTAYKHNIKTSTHQGTSKKSRSRHFWRIYQLRTESWIPYNYNKLQKYPVQYSTQKHIQSSQTANRIKNIPNKGKNIHTINNEYEIEYDEARIRQHLLTVVKVVKEDRKSARIVNYLVEELENVIIRELQEHETSTSLYLKHSKY